MGTGKFASWGAEGDWVDHDYGNIFFRQPMEHGHRLVIGPSQGHVDLMLDLARQWRGKQWYALYVLLESRTGAMPGRYQSPRFDELGLQMFLTRYRAFFESSGQHHVWVGSPSNEGLLIYDQHNVIFAYGDLANYERVLRSRGFAEREFWFPMPHAHQYPNCEDEETDLFQRFRWDHFPLQPADEW